MSFIDKIFSLVWDIATWFYAAYEEVAGWVWPFNYLSYPFFGIYYICWQLLTPIANVGEWLLYASSKIADILSWAGIWSYLLSYVPNLLQLRDWFYGWWANVTAVITAWWQSTQNTVLAWVQWAMDYALALTAQVNASLASLQASWSSFQSKIPTLDAVVAWWGSWTGNVLALVNTWWSARLLDVQGLINSGFTARESLWSGWQDWRTQVAEFFADPEQWIYNRLDSFFERFW